MRDEPVLIIGGGLGGLCLAQGLKRANIPFELFERGSAIETRGQGYRLRIDAAGQDALGRCLPVDLLYLLYQSAALGDVEPWCINGDMEAVAARMPDSWARRDTTPDLCVHRQTLREILQCGVARHIHFDHRFRYMEERENGIVASFANGVSATGSVLVGADGMASAVRTQLLPALIPQGTGFACIYGRTPATPSNCRKFGVDLCAGTSVIQAEGFAGIVDVMCFREPMPVLASGIAPDCRLTAVEDYFYWALIGPTDRLGISTPLPASTGLVEVVRRLVRGWAPPLQALFLSGDPAGWAVHPIKSLQVDRLWGSGCATLLGDAVHVMSPAGGLGASTALQDAADLAQHLGQAWNGDCLSDGLRCYEADMLPRAVEAAQKSFEGGKRLSRAMAA